MESELTSAVTQRWETTHDYQNDTIGKPNVFTDAISFTMYTIGKYSFI